VLETEVDGATCGTAKTTVRAITPIPTYIQWGPTAGGCRPSSTAP
jgi:hypothetical protein